jgi:hypothetical protein
LTVAERRVFWRILAACSEVVSADVDREEHARQIARTVVAARANGLRRVGA